ncbi:AarF/UbiB family protein [Micromonospora sp. M12]
MRDRTGQILTTLQLGAPSRVGLLHADPAKENLRLLNDGRLAVLDFGAVVRLPAGIPADFGRLLRAAGDQDGHQVQLIMRRLGVVPDGSGPIRKPSSTSPRGRCYPPCGRDSASIAAGSGAASWP